MHSHTKNNFSMVFAIIILPIVGGLVYYFGFCTPPATQFNPTVTEITPSSTPVPTPTPYVAKTRFSCGQLIVHNGVVYVVNAYGSTSPVNLRGDKVSVGIYQPTTAELEILDAKE